MARIRLGLIDPIVAQTLGQETVFSIERSKSRRGFTHIEEKLHDPAASAVKHVRMREIVSQNITIPMAGQEIANRDEIEEDQSYESKKGKTTTLSNNARPSEIQPSEILYDVFSKLSFSNSAVTEIIQSTKSEDLKEAARLYLENKKEKLIK